MATCGVMMQRSGIRSTSRSARIDRAATMQRSFSSRQSSPIPSVRTPAHDNDSISARSRRSCEEMFPRAPFIDQPIYNAEVPNAFHVLPQYQPLMRIVGLDAETVFDHPDIAAWRKLPDRENCTLDAELDGRRVRLHVKRYTATRPMKDEVAGIQLLQGAGIPTVPLVAWGETGDGRSFVMSEDLAGYSAADKLVEAGTPFESLLEPTADLAAKLHAAG